MSECLLCQAELRNKVAFTAILRMYAPHQTVCTDCHQRFVEIGNSRCERCCKVEVTGVCTDCQQWERMGEQVAHHALYPYDEEMAEYFQRFKFWGDYALRHVFAAEIRDALKRYTDYSIVPIPVGPSRYQERGFNQVAALLDAAEIRYHQLLAKADSDKQSSKSRSERLQSQQVFSLRDEKPVPEKILLVDDIYTTGATIRLAKGLLMKNGAKKIKSFSLAR